MLRLPDNGRFERENVSSHETSTMNTSFISIVQTNHLRERMAERDISTRELQAAKKHGTKYRSSSGNLRHEMGGGVYVTSKDMKVRMPRMTCGG